MMQWKILLLALPERRCCDEFDANTKYELQSSGRHPTERPLLCYLLARSSLDQLLAICYDDLASVDRN